MKFLEEVDLTGKLSPLELDVLLIFYLFCNQYGVVDMDAARSWAKSEFDLTLPERAYTLTQRHVDILTLEGKIPNISQPLFKAIRVAKKSKRTVDRGDDT